MDNKRRTEIVGGLIKLVRKEHKLNQSELASAAGVSVGTVHRLETGKGEITFAALDDICGALDLEVYQVLKPRK